MIKNLTERLYIQALRLREVENKISERYKEQRIRCPTHLSVGQEAVSAAFSLVVKKTDFAVSTHRCHAHYLGKGGSLKKMISELYGKKTGCSGGRGGSMHLIDLKCNFMGSSAIVGNSIPIGVGLALSSKLKKTKQISFVFLGDAATEQGVFYESVNFAILKKLPVIFVCENNLYSVYSPLTVRQPKNRDLTKMCSSLGIRSLKCDGNDAIKSYKTFSKVINKIRSKQEPYFIEFETYRWLEHCGPNFDNNLKYRSKKEFLNWQKKDPLKVLSKKLSKNKIKEIDEIKKQIRKEINLAFDYAERSPFPSVSSAYKGIYAK